MLLMPIQFGLDSQRRPCRTRTAFTLFEVVVVVAIMGMLAAVAIPRYANSIARRRVELAAARIVEDLALARTQAMATSASCTVTLFGGTERVRIAGMKPLDPGGSVYLTELSLSPYQVNLRDIDFGGDNNVIFNGFGVPDSGGSARVLVGKFARTITLDPQTGLAEVGP